jgi:hypothetical protein
MAANGKGRPLATGGALEFDPCDEAEINFPHTKTTRARQAPRRAEFTGDTFQPIGKAALRVLERISPRRRNARRSRWHG